MISGDGEMEEYSHGSCQECVLDRFRSSIENADFCSTKNSPKFVNENSI